MENDISNLDAQILQLCVAILPSTVLAVHSIKLEIALVVPDEQVCTWWISFSHAIQSSPLFLMATLTRCHPFHKHETNE